MLKRQNSGILGSGNVKNGFQIRIHVGSSFSFSRNFKWPEILVTYIIFLSIFNPFLWKVHQLHFEPFESATVIILCSFDSVSPSSFSRSANSEPFCPLNNTENVKKEDSVSNWFEFESPKTTKFILTRFINLPWRTCFRHERSIPAQFAKFRAYLERN